MYAYIDFQTLTLCSQAYKDGIDRLETNFNACRFDRVMQAVIDTVDFAYIDSVKHSDRPLGMIKSIIQAIMYILGHQVRWDRSKSPRPYTLTKQPTYHGITSDLLSGQSLQLAKHFLTLSCFYNRNWMSVSGQSAASLSRTTCSRK